MLKKDNLMFYDESGKSLNFNWNGSLERWEGDLLFEKVGSSEGFQSKSIYLLEKVEGFQFSDPDNLKLDKWQLFNEFKFNFWSGGKNGPINKIEPTNKNETSYSKWIFGDNFESIFPIGTLIRFKDSLFEWTNPNISFCVVGNKKGAILIISNQDNKSFNTDWNWQSPLSYINKKIESINSIGFWDYIEWGTYQETLSNWNEVGFWDRLESGRRLNIIGSDKNDNWSDFNKVNNRFINELDSDLFRGVNVVNITNNELYDNIYKVLELGQDALLPNEGFRVHIEFDGNFPQAAFDIGITFFDSGNPLIITDPLSGSPEQYTNVIFFGTNTPPPILKSGVQFRVFTPNGSSVDLVVSDIPTFESNVNLYEWRVGQQVIWNGRIRQSLKNWIWTSDSEITPDDSEFWSDPTYIPYQQITLPVGIPVGISLNSNIDIISSLDFICPGFPNSGITILSAIERLKSVLSSIGIETGEGRLSNNFYKTISLIPKWPGGWVNINLISTTTGLGLNYTTKNILERLVEVDRDLVYESNQNISERPEYKIVFNSIDESGIDVIINGISYPIETRREFLPNTSTIDNLRTVDSTLKAWIVRWWDTLVKLGIIPQLVTIDSNIPFYNGVSLIGQYPNIPIDLSLQLGQLSNWGIDRWYLILNQPTPIESLSPSIGNFIDIRINNKSYPISRDLSEDINITLSRWISVWGETIQSFGIMPRLVSSGIKFSVMDLRIPFELDFRGGISSIPGDLSWEIIPLISGNIGCLITSNSVLLDTPLSGTDFFEIGFSTGVIVDIFGTNFPLQEREYNIISLNSNRLGLSYQGPFWGDSDQCQVSPFVTVAFSNGFTQSLCLPPISGGGGMFDPGFTQSFSLVSPINGIQFSPLILNGGNSLLGSGVIDLTRVQTFNQIWGIGTDRIWIFNSESNDDLLGTISVPVGSPRRILWNSFDGFVWALYEERIFILNPQNLSIIEQIDITNGNGFSLDFDRVSGSVLVTTTTSILILSPYTGSLISNFSIPSWEVVWDNVNRFWVVGQDGILRRLGRVGGNWTLQSSITILGGITSDQIICEVATGNVWLWEIGGFINIVSPNGTISQLTQIQTSPNGNWIFQSIQTGLISVSNDIVSIVNLSPFGDIVWQSQSPVRGWLIDNPNILGISLVNQPNIIHSSSQNINNPGVLTVSGLNGQFLNLESTIQITGRMIQNPERGSIWMPMSNGDIFELVISITIFGNSQSIQNPTGIDFESDGLYGTFDSGYSEPESLLLIVREYLRRPRMNIGESPTGKIYWKWFSDNVPEFFLYDFSGNLLPTSGPFKYDGPKPLTNPVLNRNPSRDVSFNKIPDKQQTIFNVIPTSLDKIDQEDIQIQSPIETHLGFGSNVEGPLRSVLQMFLSEPIDFTIDTTQSNGDEITFTTIESGDSKLGEIRLDINSSSNFLTDSNGNSRGLVPGQYLAIFIKDLTNNRGQWISKNNGYLVKIRGVFFRTIQVEFFKEIDKFEEETTKVIDYPNPGETTFLRTRFRVWDRELLRLNVYGQTQIEDIRFKTELGNIGRSISGSDIKIFKDWDLKQDAIDWQFLNNKRKEMLMVKNMIFSYIGSYKAIVNSINYFGWGGNLELTEWWRNINPESPNYLKLKSVKISDFDKEGGNNPVSLEGTQNYDQTNLLGLSYRITDIDGNNILNSPISEIQEKLGLLKGWLETNVIPITHKIWDISGRIDTRGDSGISHITRVVNVINHYEDFTPITHRLSEAYLMPVNNGSEVWNCKIDFFYNPRKSNLGGVYPGIPVNNNSAPDQWEVEIRTWATYREWTPTKSYNLGDRVFYFDRLWESTSDGNKINNPLKWLGTPDWESGKIYDQFAIVQWNRITYIFTGLGGGLGQPSLVNPPNDLQNWEVISNWKEIDPKPIQKIIEWRSGSNLDDIPSYNFTIDSNIDPFIEVRVNSTNGGSSFYQDRKFYEIRGLLSLEEKESLEILIKKSKIFEVV